MEVITDIYSEAVARLTADPSLIEAAWEGNASDPAFPWHCLFLFATPNGRHFDECGLTWPGYGCLTNIRTDPARHFVVDRGGLCIPGLTGEIAGDARLPRHPEDITARRLPVFAGYQRQFDAMFPGRLDAWLERLQRTQNEYGPEVC